MSSPSLNRKPAKLLIISTLMLTITFSLFISHPAAGQTSDDYYNKSFAWDYNGRHWTWNLSIPKALYDAYKSVSVYSRTKNGPAGYGFLTTTKDSYIQSLAEKLNQTTSNLGYSSFDQVSFVLAFVQSLPYTSDNVTEGYNEYPRFPVETLVDDGGDCEDTSILFATLTLIMGYGTVYINPPDHYAVGVLGNNIPGGSYWTYPKNSNDTYYYCETTGNGFKIGELPDEFSGQSAYIYPIDERTQFVPNVQIPSTVEPTPTNTAAMPPLSPTYEPNPTDSTLPPIAEPTIQPNYSLSFNLIYEQPLLFIVILFAIIMSIGLAVWSIRKPKNTPSLNQTVSPTESEESQIYQINDLEGRKFCIYCGSSNKSYAAFCEACGKKIG